MPRAPRNKPAPSENNGRPFSTMQSLNPGDDAAPGTPGTGEDICPTCQGKGRVASGQCPNCGGTGTVIEGIGGA